MKVQKKIKYTVGHELKVVEFDKVLGREITTRHLTADEMKQVAAVFNAAQKDDFNEAILGARKKAIQERKEQIKKLK